MAKRMTIGCVMKGKKVKNADGTETTQSDYIQIDKNLQEPVVLKAGDFLNLESKSSQLASLEVALQKGIISEDNAAKARERYEKIPDFVRFHVIHTQK